MYKELIDGFIEDLGKKETDGHGNNKKCFLIGDYALLKQHFTVDEIEQIMKLTKQLEEKGVKVARTLDFKVISQQIRNWNADKNVLVSEGYVLQQRAKGNPLLDRTNWNEKGGRYQIDYLQQLYSISNEEQEFFNQFVKGWFEIKKLGIKIDPSKSGNFMYEQGKGITFIDLDIDKKCEAINISTEVMEQVAILLNSDVYNKCYPEVQQAAKKRFGRILEKYKSAIIEQGIDINIFNQVMEVRFSSMVSIPDEHIEESPENEVARLESVIANHIKEETFQNAEIKRLQAEREAQKRRNREKKEAERKRLDEEDEQKNGNKRYDSKMYTLVHLLIAEGVIPEEQAEIYNQVLKRKSNIYLDLNPDLFKKKYMMASIDDVIPNTGANNIEIDMRRREFIDNERFSEQTYGQMKHSIENYFRQHFENLAQNIDERLLDYSEMMGRQKKGELTDEEYINFRLLEAELLEFSKGTELFESLGIENTQVYEESERTSRYLQEKNKISEEEQAAIDDEIRATNVEFLYEALKGTGITDIVELRKIYEAQDELRVSEEELEFVLTSLSGSRTGKSLKVGVDDFRVVAERSIVEKGQVFGLISTARNDLIKHSNIYEGEQIEW